jgi:hypothetical protein
VCPLNNNDLTNIFYSFINFKNFIRIMDKKELKFYEAPACEVVELNVVSSLLAGSGNGQGIDDPDPEGFDLD